jgi:hypothetical protein
MIEFSDDFCRVGSAEATWIGLRARWVRATRVVRWRRVGAALA